MQQISLGIWVVVLLSGCTGEQFFYGLNSGMKGVVQPDTCKDECADERASCLMHAPVAISQQACEDSARQCVNTC